MNEGLRIISPTYLCTLFSPNGFIASAEEEEEEEEIKGYQTKPFPQSNDVSFFTRRRTRSHSWSPCKMYNWGGPHEYGIGLFLFTKHSICTALVAFIV